NEPRPARTVATTDKPSLIVCVPLTCPVAQADRRSLRCASCDMRTFARPISSRGTTMPRRRPKKQPEAQDQANGAARTRAGRINKMQCVRDALDEMGNDAQPKDIQGFLKRRFGLDMDTKFISTYKGTILKEAARKSGVTRRPAAVAASSAPKVARG